MMNRKEAIVWLIENPKGKLKMLVDLYGKKVEGNLFIRLDNFGCIKFDNNANMGLFVPNDKAEYEPVRELKKMCYGEMRYTIENLDLKYDKCISVVTGKDWARYEPGLSKEEFMGKWTIEGVYEEDE